MDALPDSNITDPILQAFRESGHRLTNQRIALLNALRSYNLFLDAETLHDLANTQGADLSLATVYRTLGLFKEMGLVEGRIVGDDQNREEYRFRAEREFYTLVCKRCGKIVPVEPDIVDQFRRELAETLGITVLTAHSCFIGYCAECTAAMAKEAE